MRRIIPPSDFRIAAITGAMPNGSGLWWFVFRWAHAAIKCQVDCVRLQGLAAGTAFTAGLGNVEMKRCVSMSDSGVGGTSMAITGSAAKKKISQPPTVAAAIRIATTAGLTAPTATFDANGMGVVSVGFPAVAGQQLLPPGVPLFVGADEAGPLVLGENEGFAIRTSTPGSGTWQAAVEVDWTER